MPSLLAASAFRDLFGQFLFLSMIITSIVVPVRASRHDRKSGPKRAVRVYLIACVGYYFALRFVLPRI